MYAEGQSRLLDYYLAIIIRKVSQTLHCTYKFESMRFAETDAMHNMAKSLREIVRKFQKNSVLRLQLYTTNLEVFSSNGYLLAIETNCIGNVENTQLYNPV